jgi:hypothetical protein
LSYQNVNCFRPRKHTAHVVSSRNLPVGRAGPRLAQALLLGMSMQDYCRKHLDSIIRLQYVLHFEEHSIVSISSNEKVNVLVLTKIPSHEKRQEARFAVCWCSSLALLTTFNSSKTPGLGLECFESRSEALDLLDIDYVRRVQNVVCS